MYGWIFRHIPGPTWFKVIVSLLLLAAVFYLLMNYGFPWISSIIPWNESTIDTPNAGLLGAMAAQLRRGGKDG